ncbi:MAG TPA: DinB family protein [Chthonomonadaceae bacterium]|nr:DinB family protein [Chthonomonadaceae bacterium]
MEPKHSVSEHVARLLQGGQAFDTLEEIIASIPADRRGAVPAGVERSAWQTLEHIRIAQRDILDFSRNADGSYQEKRWPDDYWPTAPAPPDAGAWDRTAAAILADRAALEALVLDERADLFAPFPWGDGQTLLREALLAAEHAAYHLGQLVMLAGLLQA